MDLHGITISRNAPKSNNLWLKPIDGGFALYACYNGKWQAMKLSDTSEDTSPALPDEVKTELIGSVKDKKTANTINGAKAYAEDAFKKVVGTKSDDASDLTLYGLKAYIETKLAEIE